MASVRLYDPLDSVRRVLKEYGVEVSAGNDMRGAYIEFERQDALMIVVFGEPDDRLVLLDVATSLVSPPFEDDDCESVERAGQA
jgi:hypothetical protein